MVKIEGLVQRLGIAADARLDRIRIPCGIIVFFQIFFKLPPEPLKADLRQRFGQEAADRKFIAAEACADIMRAAGVEQCLCDSNDRVVALQMAVGR